MKLNFIQTIIALSISLLISYGFYSLGSGENKIILSLGSFVFLASTLITMLAVSFEYPRTTTNVRVLSGVFFVVAMISNLIFIFINFSVPSYIIISGVLFLIYLLITNLIYKANQ